MKIEQALLYFLGKEGTVPFLEKRVWEIDPPLLLQGQILFPNVFALFREGLKDS